jgi:metal-responsive CopG/Arc/MetJ family transcriptional regulator
MDDGGNGFDNVSISKRLTQRVDALLPKINLFNTRASYIQDRLRRAIEEDEIRYATSPESGRDGDVKKKAEER